MAADLQFAQLVRERLARPGDVSFDLGRDLVLGQSRMLPEVLHGPFPRPPELVDAGIDDQPAGAPHLVRQTAEVLIGGLIDPHDRA